MSDSDARAVLEKILALESEKHFNDSAVTGGMDAYVALVLSRHGASLPSETGEALREPSRDPGGYAAWDIERRQRWVRTTLGLLRGELSAGQELAAATHEQMESCLRRPITSLDGVKDKNAEHLSRLGVRTVGDFLYLLPNRYLDYTLMQRIVDLQPGLEQTVLGTVTASRITLFGKRQGTEAWVEDASGAVRAVWFNQPWVAKRLQPGQRIVMSGPVGYRGRPQFESPEWEHIAKAGIHTGRLVPVYPLTKGLYERRMRDWMNGALGTCLPVIREYLPPEMVTRQGLLDLRTALRQAHFPDDMTQAGRARQRLAFDELLALQLGLLMAKHEWQDKQPGIPFASGRDYLDAYIRGLPFELTAAQARALAEIRADLQKPVAMSRMLQGDVGSGKTVVALAALLLAVANGCQSAMMAPTEVLAEQHFRTIAALLARPGEEAARLVKAGIESKRANPVVTLSGIEGLPVTVALLTGSLSPTGRKDVHAGLRQGSIDIVVGTQALVQKSVEFHRLGLAVVDEQHRFGVLQRGELRQKGYNPHVLVMTATPIPRSLALAVYGDLDLSTIDSLPPGRKEIATHVASGASLDKVYAFIRGQVGQGRQCYIVCPLISESAVLEVRAATEEHRFLSDQVFPDLRVGLLHGSLHTRHKDEVMRAFRDGEIDVLVSTTVIEVGVDVPNATVMVVLGADRFGLAQLHQLRGRVGRGSDKSYCVVVANSPSIDARERLKALRDEANGFRLASRDLELRGPGDFLGTQQSGLPQLRVATLTDLSTLELARGEATRLMQERDFMSAPLYAPLRQRVERLWNRDVEWS